MAESEVRQMVKPYRGYWEKRKRRRHRVTITEERAEQRMARQALERDQIRAEVAERMKPEVDAWEEPFNGKGDLPK